MEQIPTSRSASRPFWPVLTGAALLLVALSLGIGIYIGSTSERAATVVGNITDPYAKPPEEADFRTLFQVWQVLEDKFAPASTSEPISAEERVWGAIEGLVDSYGDEHTVFFPPEDAEIFEADISGAFEGVGMELGERDDRLTVIAPLKGSPAERAGILSGDIVLEIDGESTEDQSVDDAVKRIRGKAGTSVSLTLARKDVSEPIRLSIVREEIDIPTIETEHRSDGVFIIRLFSFSANAEGLFMDALREFDRTGSDKLIIDLRGNPGGYLQIAVNLASNFLPSGKVIVREEGREEDEVFRSSGRDLYKGNNPKMVILVDQGSASASEILAGALAEHGIATLIGAKTYGKGSVQELIELRGGSSIKVTVARWFTPNGVSISGGGLTPQFEVEYTREQFEKGEDPQLDRAVQFLLEGK